MQPYGSNIGKPAKNCFTLVGKGLAEFVTPKLEIIELNEPSGYVWRSLSTMSADIQRPPEVPKSLRATLVAVARKVFWWGEPSDWLEDQTRFLAQVMTYGDLDDIRTAMETLGRSAFQQVLENPPSGVFDIKSWTFWHVFFHLPVPPLPGRASPRVPTYIKWPPTGVPTSTVPQTK